MQRPESGHFFGGIPLISPYNVQQYSCDILYNNRSVIPTWSAPLVYYPSPCHSTPRAMHLGHSWCIVPQTDAQGLIRRVRELCFALLCLLVGPLVSITSSYFWSIIIEVNVTVSRYWRKANEWINYLMYRYMYLVHAPLVCRVHPLFAPQNGLSATISLRLHLHVVLGTSQMPNPMAG